MENTTGKIPQGDAGAPSLIPCAAPEESWAFSEDIASLQTGACQAEGKILASHPGRRASGPAGVPLIAPRVERGGFCGLSPVQAHMEGKASIDLLDELS